MTVSRFTTKAADLAAIIKNSRRVSFPLVNIFVIAVVFLLIAFPQVAQAATKWYPGSYFSAQKMIKNVGVVEMQIGETFLFSIGFKNTGKAIWSNKGKQYISVYTADPLYRNSKFADESWISVEQPVALREEVVKPGEVGYFQFKLKAPAKAGNYKETFSLAAENTKFIPGGKFTINIIVHEKPAYSALKIIQSASQLVLKKNEVADFRIGFKNTGRLPWRERALVKAGVAVASAVPNNNYELFVDSSWIDYFIPVKIINDNVLPGQVAFFDFKIKAPDTAGNYTLKMALQVDGQEVEDGFFELPITVTDETLAPPTEPQFIPRMEEPKIRIGLFEAEPTEQLQANGTFELQDENGNVIMTFEPDELVTLKPWANGVHYLQTNFGKKYSSTNYFRFVPKTATTFLLPTYRNFVSWNKSQNDNVFRGEIWYRYSPQKNKFYVINVLPLEDYLKGLAETSNNSPFEFQKAQAIAARTYALYYVLNGGKHPEKNFDLNTLPYDQVYRGYNSEQRMPNFVKAVEETRGVVITYNDKIVITPYFARSNGRTLDYTERWGGMERPWLVSRPAPYDVGKTRFGHGVGMSQTDAMEQARAGKGFEEILKLYYTGIEIKKVYK